MSSSPSLGQALFEQVQTTIEPMSGAQIQRDLLGSRVTGEYPSGQKWAEQFNLDGTTIYAEAQKLNFGRLDINGNQMCFSYNSEKLSGGCFEVWKRGANCFDFYSANNDADLLSRRFGQQWSARAWKSDQPSTCTSEQLS